MKQYRDSVLGILACLVGLTMASAAHAQVPRSNSIVATAAGMGTIAGSACGRGGPSSSST